LPLAVAGLQQVRHGATGQTEGAHQQYRSCETVKRVGSGLG